MLVDNSTVTCVEFYTGYSYNTTRVYPTGRKVNESLILQNGTVFNVGTFSVQYHSNVKVGNSTFAGAGMFRLYHIGHDKNFEGSVIEVDGTGCVNASDINYYEWYTAPGER